MSAQFPNRRADADGFSSGEQSNGVAIRPGHSLVGRAGFCHIVVPDESVSRIHAEITRAELLARFMPRQPRGRAGE